MNKIFILIGFLLFPLITFGQSINLICKFDTTKENEKFRKSFSISISQNKNGNYSIIWNEKNVETLDQYTLSVKVSDVSITNDKIGFKVYKTVTVPDTNDRYLGYDESTTEISRLDGRIINTIYWKGGLMEVLVGPNYQNPIINTGKCEKRTQNKF